MADQEPDGDLAVFTRVLSIGLQESSSQRAHLNRRSAEPRSPARQPKPEASTGEPAPHPSQSTPESPSPRHLEQKSSAPAADAARKREAQVGLLSLVCQTRNTPRRAYVTCLHAPLCTSLAAIPDLLTIARHFLVFHHVGIAIEIASANNIPSANDIAFQRPAKSEPSLTQAAATERQHFKSRHKLARRSHPELVKAG